MIKFSNLPTFYNANTKTRRRQVDFVNLPGFLKFLKG